jgi:acyl-CoA reductase-like NAD-dependent aldehyde dehydrogenase
MDDKIKKEVDAKLDKLKKGQDDWIKITFEQKIKFLEQIIANIAKYKDEWVSTTLEHRKLPRLFEEEEIASGCTPVVRLCRLLIDTLRPAAAAEKEGKSLEFSKPFTATKVDGQYRVQVFPSGRKEKILFPGVVAENWILPGYEVTQAGELLENYGPRAQGKISLVLGGGNQNSIVFMDALYKLYNQNQVVFVKYNPVNDYLDVIFEKVMKPLFDLNAIEHTKGGVEIGQYILERVDNVHVTGSDKTYDMIVWGTTDKTKKIGEPKFTKEFTSELGCVTPFIVVPGAWTDAELDYQAEHMAGAVALNNSYNCTAAKLIITMKGWDKKKRMMNTLKKNLSVSPSRYPYYPGSAQRHKAYLERYPQAEAIISPKGEGETIPWTVIENVPADPSELALVVEPFCPIISQVELEASDLEDFLQKAVHFCNDHVWGNLTGHLLVDAHTEKTHSQAVERAIKDLKYGCVGVNVWSSVAYFTGSCVWGAYPGNTPQDIQSGRGFVHNAYMLDNVEKCVIRAPSRLLLGAKYPYSPINKNKLGIANALFNVESYFSITNTFKTLYQNLWG